MSARGENEIARSLCHRTWITVSLLIAAALIPARALAQEEQQAPAEKPADPAPAEQAPAADPAENAGPDDDEAVDVARPPAKGKGVVAGIVTDTKFDEPIIEAQIQVVGQKYVTITDIDGRYRLELPPGRYRLRVTYELHQPTRVDEVRVVHGQVSRVDVQLTPDEGAVAESVVEEVQERTSTEGQTLERKRAASVGDGVGRAEIARTPDRNAAEAARRVVGATIVGERFVFVRGLGERYTNALLNGTPLPSPEPDRQSVPLDLFPSLVLDSLTITKQFTPDMPGDFAGGSVRIHTRQFPRQSLLQLSLSGGYNSNSTFRERLSDQGASGDWLALVSENRQIPPDIPDRKLERTSTSEEDRTIFGQRINSFMSAVRKNTPPNHGGSIVAGDAWKIGKEQKLGLISALTYGRSYKIRHWTIKNYAIGRLPDGSPGPAVVDDVAGEQGIDSVRWGAFGSAAVELSPEHTLSLTGLRSQSSDNSVSDLEGFYDISAQTRRSMHFEFVSRALSFGQLRGLHRFPELDDAELEWHLDLALAERDQPDTRDVAYQKNAATAQADPSYSWQPGPQSGFHFFADQSESTLGGGLDFTLPVIKNDDSETKYKVGLLVTTRNRDFTSRRFVLEPDALARGETPDAGFVAAQSCAGEAWQIVCPDQLFRFENIGAKKLLLHESTLPFDEYVAELDVYAGYAMFDAELTKQVRTIAGARIEATDQSFAAYDPFDRVGTEVGSDIVSTDFLPAFSLIFATTASSNTRFGLSRTLARPQLREIAPFLSSSYTAELPTTGNPKLVLTKITNADLRFEYFPTLREVLAVSFFYKHFEKPIEEVILAGSQAGIITYANADSADLIGTELEARKSLEMLAPVLEDFTLIANLTLARSIVHLGANAQAATNPSRPLSYQSPYVVNASLDYSNEDLGADLRVLYNVYGPRITTVGSSGLPDIYEQPRHVVDASAAKKIGKHLELKLSAENILSSRVVFAYRGKQERVALRQPDGSSVLAPDGSPIFRPGARDPVTRSYDPGTTFTLTATYTY